MRGIGIGIGLQAVSGPLLVYSNNNMASGWTGNLATIGVASENDPESGIAASDLLETAATGNHYASKNFSLTNGKNYRIRVVIKGISRVNMTVLLVDGSSKYWYNAIGSTTALLSSNTSNPQVTDLGGGWYAHSIDVAIDGGTGNKNLRIGVANSPLSTNYLGDITKGVRIGSIKIYELG